ncbi:Undecaprenyl-phosphate alpha-N-acetylglucosaminyl 1-phosphate transferase [hydrothermal vent metagenome]|uniref:Undecaprenyl-phosphate alpha-N-acetylglucosaminyl 1-phosphate transferase n=1 Tax=hydrothermal vent metagenome TaxID=652676 RepID=A0A3B1B3J0_9ZZZZ
MIAMALAFLAAALLSLWFSSAHTPLHILDAPNERSLHEHPIHRTGGLAILAGVLIGWLLLTMQSGWPASMSWIATAAALIAGVSLVDDIKELSPLTRLVVHGLAAVVLMVGGLVIPGGLFGLILTALAIVWALNLFNFMDGMDGFAGGMAAFGFGFLAIAGWLQGDIQYALYCSVVSAASVGFLCLNFPPARIFMGDTGAATLGLLAAACSLWGIRNELFPLWFPLMVFSPFIVDATVTLIRRALRRECIWEAHCTHYYQRLVKSVGWSHRKTVLWEYLLMFSVGASALLALFNVQFVPACLLFWCIAYISLACWVDTICAKSDTRKTNGHN